MRTVNILSHACTRFLNDTERNCVRKNVRAKRNVCTPPVAYTIVVTRWVKSPETDKSSNFVIPCPSWFLPSGLVPPVCFPQNVKCNCYYFSDSRDMFPILILDDAFVELTSEIRFIARTIRVSLGPDPLAKMMSSFCFLNLICFFVHADDDPYNLIIFWTTFGSLVHLLWMTLKRYKRSVLFMLFWRDFVRNIDCSVFFPNIRFIFSSNYVVADLHEILHHSGSCQESTCRFHFWWSFSSTL